MSTFISFCFSAFLSVSASFNWYFFPLLLGLARFFHTFVIFLGILRFESFSCNLNQWPSVVAKAFSFFVPICRDSCLQFVGLSKRMNSFRQLDEDCDSQTVDDASTDSEMSLESGTDTGIATETDDCASWTSRVFDSSSNVQFDRLPESRSPIIKWDSNADSPGEISTFACGTPARVRSRWGPPERIRIYSLESEVQDYEIPTKASKVEQNANGVCQQSISNSDSGEY